MTRAWTWQLAGGVSNPHPYQGALSWGPFVAVPVLLVGVPLALAGLALTVKSRQIAKKRNDYLVGPVVLLLGILLTTLGGWLF